MAARASSKPINAIWIKRMNQSTHISKKKVCVWVCLIVNRIGEGKKLVRWNQHYFYHGYFNVWCKTNFALAPTTHTQMQRKKNRCKIIFVWIRYYMYIEAGITSSAFFAFAFEWTCRCWWFRMVMYFDVLNACGNNGLSNLSWVRARKREKTIVDYKFVLLSLWPSATSTFGPEIKQSAMKKYKQRKRDRE